MSFVNLWSTVMTAPVRCCGASSQPSLTGSTTLRTPFAVVGTLLTTPLLKFGLTENVAQFSVEALPGVSGPAPLFSEELKSRPAPAGMAKQLVHDDGAI